MGSRLNLLYCMALLTALPGAQAAGQEAQGSKSGIVKWVDEKGVTHYGDAIPPEYASRSNTTLNKSGRVLKQNEAFKPATQQTAVDADQEKQKAEQQRRDQVLLASYTTEQEIDLARDRNTQMDEAAIKGLEQRAASARERLAQHQKSAATFITRKKPVPQDIQQDIDAATGELGRIEDQIAQKRKDIEATRTRFERDRQRFHELKLGSAPQAAQPTAKKSN